MTLGDKSVKIELRQRIYSSKTSDYKIVHLPYLLEIKEKMTWKDVNEAIANLINRGNENANEAKKRETI